MGLPRPPTRCRDSPCELQAHSICKEEMSYSEPFLWIISTFIPVVGTDSMPVRRERERGNEEAGMVERGIMWNFILTFVYKKT